MTLHFMLHLKVHLRVTFLDVHGGVLVSAQECKKRLSKRLNFRRNSMLHLNVCLRYYFRKHLKMYKHVKEKMQLMLHLMIL